MNNKPNLNSKPIQAPPTNAQIQQLSNSQPQIQVQSASLFAPNQMSNSKQQVLHNLPPGQNSLFGGYPLSNSQQQMLFNSQAPQQSLFATNSQPQMMTNAQTQQQMSMNYPQPYIQPPLFGNQQQNFNNANNGNEGLYNDDEPLIQKAKEQSKNVKIQLEIKAQRSLVKLKTQTELPAMATLRSTGGTRTSVDLICVIDNSGSMSGEKIQLVKSTVRFLLETLTPSDRLSIITFNSYANRLCGLKCVTGENMQSFMNIVNSINAGGGTVINSGLNLALKTMRERKHINKVTSIFLLSDGQDGGAEVTFKQTLQLPINRQLGPFTLHSFGFGADHDENLMSKLCQLKDGAFYFIKQLATLDEAFCNALGAIISLVANEVIIKISNISKGLAEGVKIKKVYGNMWQKINDKEYKIKLMQLMHGITRDFVFQLEIPAINAQIGDLERDHNIIEAIFQAKSIQNKQLTGECVLQLTFLNQSQNIPDTVENVEVIENYLRVKAAEVIEENLKKADKHQYAEAQKGIDTMIQCIQQNKKARKEKMDYLITDLNQIKQKCSQQDYAQEGRKIMMSAQQSHTMQNNFMYSNSIQGEMLNKMKAQKKN